MRQDEALGHYATGLLHGVLIVVGCIFVGLVVELVTR